VTAPRTETGSFRTPPVSGEALPVITQEGEELLEMWNPEMRPQAPASNGVLPRHDDPLESPRISLCMITKNEEQLLGECLQSAAQAVDEIIIVDTGSTDRTVQIAESYGARVLHSPWEDNFSVPRNKSLQAATGDWILVLDADERLQPGAGEKIRELVRTPGMSGYNLVFKNLYSHGKTVGVLMVRLFRKFPGIAYEKRLHEQVVHSLARESEARGMVVGTADVEVVHHGYTDELMAQKRKNERNERLFKLQLRDDPDDIYSHYKYGDFLRRVPGRNRDARAALEETLELILAHPPSVFRGIPYAGEVAALCALEYAREGHHAKAMEIVETGLRQFIPTPNLHYIAASLALAIDRNDDAIAHYHQCFRYRGEVLIVPVQEGITGHVSITGLAQAWLQKGDHVKARRLLEQAIAIRPDYDVSHMVLSKLCFGEGDMSKALTVLTDYLVSNPDSPGVCHQATLILKTMGLKDQARRMGERALQVMDDGAMDYESENLKRTLATLC
jgi:glycosyltransferase involved in cell wall biosynthesis